MGRRRYLPTKVAQGTVLLSSLKSKQIKMKKTNQSKTNQFFLKSYNSPISTRDATVGEQEVRKENTPSLATPINHLDCIMRRK